MNDSAREIPGFWEEGQDDFLQNRIGSVQVKVDEDPEYCVVEIENSDGACVPLEVLALILERAGYVVGPKPESE